MQLFFKPWLELQSMGGGLQPPQQSPVDPEPSPGQTDAFPRHYSRDSDELPPTKKQKKATVFRRKLPRFGFGFD